MQSAPLGVLSSQELLRYVLNYQDGYYKDLLPYLSLRLHETWMFENRQPNDTIIKTIETLKIYLSEWLIEYGIFSLPRLWKSIPSMRIILPLYCAYIGDLNTLQRIAGLDSTILEQPLGLLHLAAKGGSLEVVRFLVSNRFLFGSNLADTTMYHASDPAILSYLNNITFHPIADM